jgi:hypothetical protein
LFEFCLALKTISMLMMQPRESVKAHAPGAEPRYETARKLMEPLA